MIYNKSKSVKVTLKGPFTYLDIFKVNKNNLLAIYWYVY